MIQLCTLQYLLRLAEILRNMAEKPASARKTGQFGK